jgi:type II secretory pathway pseudopilin PulG
MNEPLKDHTSPKEHRGSEAGFTLVEAMCAIVILAFGLIAIANLMAVAASSNSVANQSTAATTLATQQLERLKNIPFTTPGTNVLNPLLTPGGDLDNDAAGYFLDPLAPAAGDPPVDVPGVGQIRVRWQIAQIDPRSLFIVVRAEGTGALSGARSRAEFTVFRACTDSAPPPGLNCP